VYIHAWCLIYKQSQSSHIGVWPWFVQCAQRALKSDLGTLPEFVLVGLDRDWLVWMLFLHLRLSMMLFDAFERIDGSGCLTLDVVSAFETQHDVI
jgi:hypothetical protein